MPLCILNSENAYDFPFLKPLFCLFPYQIKKLKLAHFHYLKRTLIAICNTQKKGHAWVEIKLLHVNPHSFHIPGMILSS